MKLRRKTGIGIHRMKVPGKGWCSIRPGEVVPGDHDDIKFLGNQNENYIAISGEMPIDKPEDPGPARDYALYTEKVTGGYNVINSGTKEPVNDKPLTVKEARALLDISEKDCPLREGEFGKSYDEFEQCSGCINENGCKKGK